MNTFTYTRVLFNTKNCDKTRQIVFELLWQAIYFRSHEANPPAFVVGRQRFVPKKHHKYVLASYCNPSTEGCKH